MAINKSGMSDWKKTNVKTQTNELSKQRESSNAANLKDNQKATNKDHVSRQMLKNMKESVRPEQRNMTQKGQMNRASEATRQTLKGQDPAQQQQQTKKDQETKLKQQNDAFNHAKTASSQLTKGIMKAPEQVHKGPEATQQQSAKATEKQVEQGARGIPGDKAQAAAKGAKFAKVKKNAQQKGKSADNTNKAKNDQSGKKIENLKGKADTQADAKAAKGQNKAAAQQAGREAGIGGNLGDAIKASKPKESTGKDAKVEGKKGKKAKSKGRQSKTGHVDDKQQRFVDGLSDVIGGGSYQGSPFDAEAPVEDDIVYSVVTTEKGPIDIGETYTNIPEFAKAVEAKEAAMELDRGTIKKMIEKVEYNNWSMQPESLSERFVEAAVEEIEGTIDRANNLIDQIRKNASAPNSPRGYGTIC